MARTFDTDILVISTVPTLAGHVTRKDYVDGQIATRLALAGGTMAGTLTLATDPVNGLDAASKRYVDNVSQGLQAKNSVLTVATFGVSGTAAGAGVGKTITNGGFGAFPAINGYTCVQGDRILLTTQMSSADNGIYVLTTQGDAATAYVLTRATDMDDDTEVVIGDHFLVDQGTHAGEMWMLSAKTGIVDAAGSAITFIKMMFGNAYSADEATLHLTGYQFSVKAQGIAPGQLGAVAAANGGLAGGNGAALSVVTDGSSVDLTATGQVEIKNVAPAKIGSLVSGTNAGAITKHTPYSIVHNAGYKKGFPLFFDPVALTPIDPDWAFLDANTLSVTTASDYAAGALGYMFLGAA